MKSKLGGLLLPAMLLVYVAVILPEILEKPSPEVASSMSPILDSSRQSGRMPLQPDDPLPEAPAADPRDVATVREALATISDAAKARRGGCGNIYFGGGRFLIERDFNYREYRLLAEAYPDAAERVAEELVGTPMGSREYHAGLKMLEYIGRQGRRRPELLLLRAAVSPLRGGGERQEALYGLSELDRGRIYQDLYRKEWSTGSMWACNLLDLSSDRLTEQLLMKISGPDYMREDAEKALGHLRLLRDPDSVARLIEIIGKTPSRDPVYNKDDEEAERRWALRVTTSRRLDLRAVLRVRLDRDLINAREAFRTYPQGPSFEENYRTDVHLFPRDWDRALVAFVDMGGTPNPLERERLREFGYLCNPKLRLGEILRELKLKPR